MILLIDNYDSFTYNLSQMIREDIAEVQVVRNDKITIKDIKQLSPTGIILSPGPGRPENAGVCIEVIRHFSGEVPILGVCLGHQAVAVAFGGAIVQSSEIVHGKKSVVFHGGGPLYQNISSPFTAGRYHSLLIERKSLPPVLKIESETADQLIMGIRHIEHLTFGVQFHPESILSTSAKNILDNFMVMCQSKVKAC